MHLLPYISQLVHNTAVAVVGFLVVSTLALVWVFFKVFEGDIFNSD